MISRPLKAIMPIPQPWELQWKKTHPQVVVAGQVDATPRGNGGALVDPRTCQGTSLPDADKAARLEAEVDAIAGSTDDARVVRPALATARARVGVARRLGGQQGERKQRFEEIPDLHDENTEKQTKYVIIVRSGPPEDSKNSRKHGRDIRTNDTLWNVTITYFSYALQSMLFLNGRILHLEYPLKLQHPDGAACGSIATERNSLGRAVWAVWGAPIGGISHFEGGEGDISGSDRSDDWIRDCADAYVPKGRRRRKGDALDEMLKGLSSGRVKGGSWRKVVQLVGHELGQYDLV
jgi:hypothetical protein